MTDDTRSDATAARDFRVITGAVLVAILTAAAVIWGLHALWHANDHSDCVTTQLHNAEQGRPTTPCD